MQNHTVEVDLTRGDEALSFAPVFNAAVPFIDRHLLEGRADKVVIRTNLGVNVTYDELAEKRQPLWQRIAWVRHWAT